MQLTFDDIALGGLKPLVKWSGGKRNEIKNFSHHFPVHFDRYIEPFVGGGAVFFNMAFPKSLIADVHEELINFYKVVKYKADGLHDRVSSFDLGEKTYYYVRDEMNADDPVDNAARFYYLRKNAFRGMLRYNSKGKFNIPWGRYDHIDISDLKDNRYSELLRSTTILCASYEEIFKVHNDKSNFVFLDPPYDSEFTDYGYCKFEKENQENLAETFKTTKNKCLMIIGKTSFIEELYSGYIVDSYSKTYQFKIHSGRIGDEIDNEHLIIKNY